jgi:hypothetical protein
MYSKPARLIAAPSAFTNNSGTRTTPRTASQARRSAAVSFQSGRHRSFRPLPRTRMLGVGCRDKFSSGRPTNSETRRPPAKQRCSIARSRIPSRVVTFGALRIALTSSIERCRTNAWSWRFPGMAWTCRAGDETGIPSQPALPMNTKRLRCRQRLRTESHQLSRGIAHNVLVREGARLMRAPRSKPTLIPRRQS